jgi:hypothetical protein
MGSPAPPLEICAGFSRGWAMTWSPHTGCGGQGTVTDDDTGRTVAVAYDVKDAPLLAAAPEMAALLRGPVQELVDYMRSALRKSGVTLDDDAPYLVGLVRTIDRGAWVAHDLCEAAQ